MKLAQAWAEGIEAAAKDAPTVADREAVIRQALAAQLPAAIPVLDAGLLAHAESPAAWAAFLVREVAPGDIGRDPVAAAWSTLDKLDGLLRTMLPTSQPALVTKILNGLKLVATMQASLPREETADALVTRIEAVRDAAIDRIGVLTGDAAAKLTRDRAAFAADVLAGKLAPVEIVRRVDAMLGGATT